MASAKTPAVPVATKRTVVPLATAKKAAPAPAPAKAAPKLATAKAAPAPVARAAKAAPAPAEGAVRESTRGIAGTLAGKKVKVLVQNPKRPNTKAYAMFDLYRNGMTYAELRSAGVSVADIDWNIKHEFVAFA